MADEEGSLRDEIEAAIESTESEIVDAKNEVIPDSPHPDAPPVETAPEVEPEKTPEVVETKSEDKPEPTAKDAPDSESEETAPKAEAVGAPESWTPAARERWKDVPEEVQSQIAKREAEMTKTFQATANARRTADNFQQVMAPYQALMAADGITDPMEGVSNMMKTVAALSMGNKAQRAQHMAALIQHYDIDIATLDDALVGEASDPETTKLEQMLEQRLAPVNDLLQRFNSAQANQAEQQNVSVASDINTFSQNAEFLNDVRMDMATIFDTAAANNQEMDLQRAYDIACQMNPNVKSVLDQRAENTRITSGNSNLSRKRAAASSISGAPGGSNVNRASTDGSLRADLEAAIESAQSG